MRSSWLVVWGACVSLLGCGSSSDQNFFDAANGARVTSSSGGAGSAGSGSASGGSAGAPSAGSNGTCSPATDLSGGSSGPFNTADAVCMRVTSAISGWGCSNFDGRSVKVNGIELTCGQTPLPDPIAGAYYFEISAGTFAYASFYWF